MGLTCIKDHSGDSGWLNGCAQCEVEALAATLSRQQAAYEREITLDVAEVRRRCAELVAAVRAANAGSYAVFLPTAAQESAWAALLRYLDPADS